MGSKVAMKAARWSLLGLALGGLAATLFADPTIWSVSLFFGSGALWCWLKWRRALVLDGLRRRADQ
ncbi:MAG: hypothetical protein HY549_09885 [Elusimicrobia bacterium]|nr:hypothetical protein [Elusimicrobiota bacterium]